MNDACRLCGMTITPEAGRPDASYWLDEDGYVGRAAESTFGPVSHYHEPSRLED